MYRRIAIEYYDYTLCFYLLLFYLINAVTFIYKFSNSNRGIDMRVLAILSVCFLLLGCISQVASAAGHYVDKINRQGSSNSTSNSIGRNYRAVIIGISDYPGTQNDLSTPVKSALAIKSCLERGSSYYTVKLLTDGSATLSNVRNALDWLKSKADENDISFVYYCGHGSQVETKNRRQEGDSMDECLFLYDDIMRDDEFVERLLDIKGIVFVILDCCKSAGFQDDLEYRYDKDKGLWEETKVFMVTAFTENQLHYEIPVLGYGLLSFHIIGTMSQDPDNDGSITIDEIYMLARENFERAKEVFGISYEGGVNIYPRRGTNHYYDYMDTPIIKGFRNKSPWLSDLSISTRRGKCELDLRMIDPDKNKMKIFVYWGDGEGEWYGPYRSYEDVSISHYYDRYDDYKIGIVIRDSHGAISMWEIKEVSIDNKDITKNATVNPIKNVHSEEKKHHNSVKPRFHRRVEIFRHGSLLRLIKNRHIDICLLYTSPSPRDRG